MFAWLPGETWNVYHSIRTKFHKSTLKEKYAFLTNLTFNNELYGVKLYKIPWHLWRYPQICQAANGTSERQRWMLPTEFWWVKHTAIRLLGPSFLKRRMTLLLFALLLNCCLYDEHGECIEGHPCPCVSPTVQLLIF